MTTITLQFDKVHNVWKATGKDAKVVFNAIGLNDYFKVHGDQPAIILPDRLKFFTSKMRDNYDIEVITIK